MSNVSNADHASVPCEEIESPQRCITLNRTLLGTGVSVLLTALPAIAQAEALDKVETPNPLALEPVPIIPVDRLADVQPSDWANGQDSLVVGILRTAFRF
jgi:hypothetical protein